MRPHPDDVRQRLVDALVRKDAGLPPLIDDHELLKQALGAIEDLASEVEELENQLAPY